MLTNRKTVRIEWGDCDPAGIIYFPRYFEHFDACFTTLLERAGCSQRNMQKKYGILGFPLVDARARFIVPTTYDDKVIVESCVTKFGRSSFEVRHRLFKDGVLAVEGFETRVCVSRVSKQPGNMKSTSLPAEFIRRLSGPLSTRKKAKGK